MSLIAAILLALSAIVATPETESPAFAIEVIMHCEPADYGTWAGCEMRPGHPEDEWSYAGWQSDLGEPLSPITGP